MWDFKHPEVSEQRFRSALQGAVGDDALILQTQIARTFGLRKDFTTARELLKNIEPSMATAGAEARVRYQLELGRTYASATHAPELLTPDAKERARAAYNEALQIAQAAHLDGLAIDAIHMLAFVDTSPEDQLKWAQNALAVVEASTQPEAKRWEASIRNNLGYALHQLGRYDEALQQFNEAVTLRERGTDAGNIRVAYWMVAWTLRAMQRNDEALRDSAAARTRVRCSGRTGPLCLRRTGNAVSRRRQHRTRRVLREQKAIGCAVIRSRSSR